MNIPAAPPPPPGGFGDDIAAAPPPPADARNAFLEGIRAAAEKKKRRDEAAAASSTSAEAEAEAELARQAAEIRSIFQEFQSSCQQLRQTRYVLWVGSFRTAQDDDEAVALWTRADVEERMLVQPRRMLQIDEMRAAAAATQQQQQCVFNVGEVFREEMDEVQEKIETVRAEMQQKRGGGGGTDLLANLRRQQLGPALRELERDMVKVKERREWYVALAAAAAAKKPQPQNMLDLLDEISEQERVFCATQFKDRDERGQFVAKSKFGYVSVRSRDTIVETMARVIHDNSAAAGKKVVDKVDAAWFRRVGGATKCSEDMSERLAQEERESSMARAKQQEDLDALLRDPKAGKEALWDIGTLNLLKNKQSLVRRKIVEGKNPAMVNREQLGKFRESLKNQMVQRRFSMIPDKLGDVPVFWDQYIAEGGGFKTESPDHYWSAWTDFPGFADESSQGPTTLEEALDIISELKLKGAAPAASSSSSSPSLSSPLVQVAQGAASQEATLRGLLESCRRELASAANSNSSSNDDRSVQVSDILRFAVDCELEEAQVEERLKQMEMEMVGYQQLVRAKVEGKRGDETSLEWAQRMRGLAEWVKKRRLRHSDAAAAAEVSSVRTQALVQTREVLYVALLEQEQEALQWAECFRSSSKKKTAAVEKSFTFTELAHRARALQRALETIEAQQKQHREDYATTSVGAGGYPPGIQRRIDLEKSLPRCNLSHREMWVLSGNVRVGGSDQVLKVSSNGDLTKIRRTYCWANVWVSTSNSRPGDSILRRRRRKGDDGKGKGKGKVQKFVRRNFWR